MKITGIFKILDSFKITGRGFVARGIITEGRIKAGSFISLRINSKEVVLQIKGVDFIDNVSARESWIGLTFVYENQEHLKELEIQGWKSNLQKYLTKIKDHSPLFSLLLS